MPNAATAYPRYEEQPSHPDLRVVRGRRGAHSEPILGPWHSAVFRTFCVAVVCIVLCCVARVALTVSTYDLLVEAQDTTAAIEKGYADSAQLEIERSRLANPTRIQSIATDLGMGPAASISYLDVSGARATARVGAVSDTACSLSAAVTEISTGQAPIASGR